MEITMKKKPIPPYKEPKEKHIGMEIRSLGNLTMRFMDKYSHREKVDAATGTNGWILRFLAESEKEGKDVFQRDIEKKFCVTRSTVSKVLTLMEQKGFIERRIIRGDARLRKIVMTEKAHELHKLMENDCTVMEKAIENGLTPEEMETFYAITAKIKNNLIEALEG